MQSRCRIRPQLEGWAGSPGVPSPFCHSPAAGGISTVDFQPYSTGAVWLSCRLGHPWAHLGVGLQLGREFACGHILRAARQGTGSAGRGWGQQAGDGDASSRPQPRGAVHPFLAGLRAPFQTRSQPSAAGAQGRWGGRSRAFCPFLPFPQQGGSIPGAVRGCASLGAPGAVLLSQPALAGEQERAER